MYIKSTDMTNSTHDSISHRDLSLPQDKQQNKPSLVTSVLFTLTYT